MATQLNFPTAFKPESMGVCFVGKKKRFDKFLCMYLRWRVVTKLNVVIAEYLRPRPGSIINQNTGKKIGSHKGIWNFTIGQSAKILGMSEKMCVSGKDITTNIVYVVPGM